MGRDTEQTRKTADHPPNGRGAESAAEQAARAYAIAIEHFGKARLAHAEAACKEALAGQPQHFDSLHLQGMIYAQKGALDDAAQSIGRALELNPDSADAHNSLGIVFRQQGNPRKALGCYDVALSKRPSYVEALNNRGIVLRVLRRFDEAIESHDRALKLAPDNPGALRGLGRSLMRVGRVEEAINAFERVARLAPGSAAAHWRLGHALNSFGRTHASIKALKRALELNPELGEAHYELGLVYREQKEFGLAEESVRRALSLKPNHADAHHQLGGILVARSRQDEAIACYTRAVELRPNFAAAINNLGYVLVEQDRLSEAIDIYKRAASASPNRAEIRYNLGNVLLMRGDYEGADKEYRKAIQLEPNYAEANWAECLLLLRTGDLAGGWEKYNWRWKVKEFGGERPAFSKPYWSGEQLTDETVLLHSEQGFGDTLQFCRYAPLVKRRGGRVVLECRPELKRLLSSLVGVDEVIGRGEPRPAFDYQNTLMNLPQVFGTTLASIPPAVPYLEPSLQKKTYWKNRLGGDDRLKVGVVWFGASRHKGDRNRSIPAKEYARLLDVGGVRFFGLSKEQRDDDNEVLAKHPAPFENLGPSLADFEDTAAAITALDLVITVDTAVAHLAGALGKPVWVLISFVPDWRWLLAREDSPWYPTVRLIRQTARGDWPQVLEKVKHELRQKVDEGVARGTPDRRSESRSDEDFDVAVQLYHRDERRRAEEICQKILQAQPKHARALHLLGVIACRRGNVAEGEEFIRGALASDVRFAEAHNSLGIALRQQDRVEEARARFRTAITLAPDYAEAHSNLGELLRSDGATKEAVLHLERAAELRPKLPAAHSDLARALADEGRLREAAESCDRAIALKHDFAPAHLARGSVRNLQGNLKGAARSYRCAISIDPGSAGGHNNLGGVLKRMGKFDEALSSYRQATAINADYAEAHLNESLILLLRGDFERGWQKYAWRWKLKSLIRSKREFVQPVWNGEDLEGKSILLHHEQGFGDTIQFCRFAPLIAARGGKVILECQPTLRSLLSQIEGVHQVIAQPDVLTSVDYQVALLDLPRILGLTAETIPAKIPYLAPSEERLSKWKDRLSGEEDYLNVGVAWFGAAPHPNDRNRSIPIQTFSKLLDVKGVRFFGLNKEERKADIAALRTVPNFENIGSSFEDFEDTAAAVAALDLVITVDTAVAHVAGALGKPVWTLLPFVPDWRWMLDRDDSPWYPTMRLFREARSGDWSEVLERVKAELTAWKEDRDGRVLAKRKPKGGEKRHSNPARSVQVEERFFADNGQDKFLEENVFKGKTKGTFVDVGGHDGVQGSNTFFFERFRGWNGICIEASPSQYEKMVKNRSVECLDVALADFEGEAEFFEVTKGVHQMGGLTQDLRPNIRELIARREGSESQIVQVPVTTFRKLAAERGLRHVDYCSIDVEGAEIRVLNGIDFEFTDISVISIENPSNLVENFHNIRRFLDDRGYRLVVTVGADDIFVRR